MSIFHHIAYMIKLKHKTLISRALMHAQFPLHAEVYCAYPRWPPVSMADVFLFLCKIYHSISRA